MYAASKAAVVRFTAALAPLGRRLNIRVNCICPDWVDTPSVQRTRAAMSPEEWRAMTPAVMTKPEEIAEAVLTIISIPRSYDIRGGADVRSFRICCSRPSGKQGLVRKASAPASSAPCWIALCG